MDTILRYSAEHIEIAYSILGIVLVLFYMMIKSVSSQDDLPPFHWLPMLFSHDYVRVTIILGIILMIIVFVITVICLTLLGTALDPECYHVDIVVTGKEVCTS